MRNNKALFDFLHDEVVYGSGGDGEGYVFLKDTDAKQMANDFMDYLKSENKLFGYKLEERDYLYCVYEGQESFCFTNQPYVESDYPYADVVIKLY